MWVNKKEGEKVEQGMVSKIFLRLQYNNKDWTGNLKGFESERYVCLDSLEYNEINSSVGGIIYYMGCNYNISTDQY